MRRILILLIWVSIFLCSCYSPSPNYETPVNFYYPVNPQTYPDGTAAIMPEVRNGSGFESNITGLFSLYLAGPNDERLTSNFPDGTHLKNLLVGEEMVQITLSSQFSRLNGFALSTACACISMTLFEMCQVEEVQISVQDGLIDGKEWLIIHKDMLILEDTMPSTGTVD